MSGFVIWMTGLSGAGKSTLASLLSHELTRRGKHVECLDGDDVRKNISPDLGFSREDRDSSVRRVGYVARMVARSGAVAITASISPYRALRDEIRSKTDNFVEVFCDCPLEVLTGRDPKGLYKRALAGEIKNFTGVDDPYEAPEHPDVHLHTDTSTADECLEKILDVLAARGLFQERKPAESLPGAIGGEVFEARKAALAEWDAIHHRITVSDELAEAMSAVGSGYLSPLSGFMTQREAIKVTKDHALERGTPWWDQPLLLPLGKDVNPPANGELVSLNHQGRDVAIMRVEEIWETSDQSYLAGPLEALAEEAYSKPTAREFRRMVVEQDWKNIACLFTSQAPEERSMSHTRLALALADSVVVAVSRPHVAAWQKELERLGGNCLALPVNFPVSNENARSVLQHSIGAASNYLID